MGISERLAISIATLWWWWIARCGFYRSIALGWLWPEGWLIAWRRRRRTGLATEWMFATQSRTWRCQLRLQRELRNRSLRRPERLNRISIRVCPEIIVSEGELWFATIGDRR